MELLLRLVQGGLGDTVAATALARDLKTGFPDSTVVVEGTSAPAVFANNPHATGRVRTDASAVPVDYRPTIDRAHYDKSVRYVYAAHEAFERETGLTVPRGAPVPELYPDRALSLPGGRYWVVFAGSRWDMPIKQWPPDHFAEVVRLTPEVHWVQAGRLFDGRSSERHVAIPGCENWIGRTDERRLFDLVAGSAGVLTHLSVGLLLAGALGKPCVVLAGGREAPWQHDSGRYDLVIFESIGRYKCCERSGCSRRIAAPVHDAAPYPPGWLCELPVADPDVGHVAGCLADISPGAVAAAVRKLFLLNTPPTGGIMSC